jgi:hypothetical protein
MLCCVPDFVYAYAGHGVQGLERLIARSYYQSSYDRDLVNLFVERGIDIKDPRTR